MMFIGWTNWVLNQLTVSWSGFSAYRCWTLRDMEYPSNKWSVTSGWYRSVGCSDGPIWLRGTVSTLNKRSKVSPINACTCVVVLLSGVRFLYQRSEHMNVQQRRPGLLEPSHILALKWLFPFIEISAFKYQRHITDVFLHIGTHTIQLSLVVQRIQTSATIISLRIFKSYSHSAL